MLQVRAGRCPGCKEEAPPGAEYCPICGEYLGWQTTSGKNIPRTKTNISQRSKGKNVVRLLIFFLAAYLVSLLAFRVLAPSNSVTEMPPLQSVPAASDNGITDDDLSENALTGNTVGDSSATDNSATGNSATDNAVTPGAASGSSVADNAVSGSASTPVATATPAAGNQLPDFDLQ